MKRHLLALLAAATLLFSACTTGNQVRPQVDKTKAGSTEVTASNPVPAGPATEPVTAAEAEKLNQTAAASAEPTADPYALHHRVFPNLLFKTEGKFFTSLHDGDFNALREVVAKNYGEPYARAMRFKSVSSPDIVFVSFAEPSRPPLCYHLALIRTGGSFSFLTLEKTKDILSEGYKTAFCGWSADGKHMNFGPRLYTSLKEFEDEVVKFVENETAPEPAAITTPAK